METLGIGKDRTKEKYKEEGTNKEDYKRNKTESEKEIMSGKDGNQEKFESIEELGKRLKEFPGSSTDGELQKNTEGNYPGDIQYKEAATRQHQGNRSINQKN